VRLTPQNTKFYEFFITTAENISATAALVKQVVGAPKNEREELAAKIKDAEHAGDKLTREIMNELNSSFITPFDREDIHELASNLDDVLDYMDEAADRIVLYRINELPDGTEEVTSLLIQMADATTQAMQRLNGLKDMESFWTGIERLEHEADILHREIVAKLFNSGHDDVLKVVKLKEIADLLEAASNGFERVAHTVETIAVKEA
jgi:predicted phosphate transport protein (TIGR00153 family)